MRRPAGTLGVVAFGRTFRVSLTGHYRRVKVKGVIVEQQFREEPLEKVAEHALVDGLRELVEIALVSPVVSPALPAKQVAKRSVIAHNVKMPETAGTTPHTCKQSQYELQWFVPPVGTLDRNITLLKVLIETAFVKHLEEQGKTTEGGDFLIDELYVTIPHQISGV